MIGDTFLVCTQTLEGKRQAYWLTKEKDDMSKLARATRTGVWVGFNNHGFDNLLLAAAFADYTLDTLTSIAWDIIGNGKKPWQVYRDYRLEPPSFDSIDIMKVPPGVAVSLKLYAGRMGARSLRDLPFEPSARLDKAQLKTLKAYCEHDVETTRELYRIVAPQIALREKLGKRFGVDLRSKSDAQCAEAIFKEELGLNYNNEGIPRVLVYTSPKWLTPRTKEIQRLIDLAECTDFQVSPENGRPSAAAWMSETVRIGNGRYAIGIGGLHSQHDTTVAYRETTEYGISDFDVASYYPSILLNADLKLNLPPGLSNRFLDIYRQIHEERLTHKAAGAKVEADTLKIVLNGTFGKLGNRFCPFYSPEAMLAITLTGQLNLLDLISRLVAAGFHCASANTDGILVQYPHKKREAMLEIFAENSKRTGLAYEETPYRWIGLRDVNNYIARISAGKIKRKGAYSASGVLENTNPAFDACVEAAVAHCDMRPWRKLLRQCADLKKFLAVRTVRGGCVQHTSTRLVNDWIGEARNWRRPGWPPGKKSLTRVSPPPPVEERFGGTPAGRIARWYMSTRRDLPPVTYLSNGNIVPGTTNGRLLLDLPDRFPDDLDWAWYEQRTCDILQETGLDSHFTHHTN